MIEVAVIKAFGTAYLARNVEERDGGWTAEEYVPIGPLGHTPLKCWGRGAFGNAVVIPVASVLWDPSLPKAFT